MPRARITKEEYDALVLAYREKPGVFSHAARKANVTHRTAKRAWTTGWPSPQWARPIREIFEQEQVSARAILASEQAQVAQQSAKDREERELAKVDAARERSREAEGVRAALSTALSLMANIGAFSRATNMLTQAAAKQLIDELSQPGATIPWREAVQHLKNLSLIGERAVSQLKEAMQALRLHLGEPEKLIGLVDASGPTILVDGQTAVAALGEDRLRQAVIDLASGNITDDVERLIAWQAEQPPPMRTIGPGKESANGSGVH